MGEGTFPVTYMKKYLNRQLMSVVYLGIFFLYIVGYTFTLTHGAVVPT